MDIICEQATYCLLHWSHLSYYKKTLWQLLQWQSHNFQRMNTGSASSGGALCLPNTTRTALCAKHTITHTGTFSSLRPQKPVISTAAIPGLQQRKRLSEGPARSEQIPWQLWVFPLLTWQSWRSRGFLLLVPGSAMWMVCSKLFWDFQGRENFWLLLPCHVLLGGSLCKLLAHGPLSFSSCQKMSFLSLQTSPAHAKLWTNITWKLFHPILLPTSPVSSTARCLIYSKLLFYRKQVFWCKKNSTKFILLDALHCT